MSKSSREISIVCRLKCPLSCFSSHYCFPVIFLLLTLALSVMFLTAVISLLPRFLCRVLVIVSMHWHYLECWTVLFLHFFLDTYNLSTSSLGCEVLCIVMIFLIVAYIWWSSSLVRFKNAPKYLTRATAQVFIPMMRFLLCSFVSRSFFVLLRYSF